MMLNLRDFINYKKGTWLKTIDDGIKQTNKRQSPFVMPQALDIEKDKDKIEDLLKKNLSKANLRGLNVMYGLDPDHTYDDIPFYMLNEREIAQITDAFNFYYPFSEDDINDFLFYIELLFTNGELEMSFLSNSTNVDNEDFIFAMGNAEYRGKYKRFNELIGKVRFYKPEVDSKKDAYENSQFLNMDRFALFINSWNYYITHNMWDKYKKVYSLSKDLRDDFMATYKADKMVEIPLSILNRVPFDIFYLNLRGQGFDRSVVEKIDGVFIKVLRSGEDVIGISLGQAIYATNGAITDYSVFYLGYKITPDDDGIVRINKTALKEMYRNAKGRYLYSGDNFNKEVSFRSKLIFICLETLFYLCCSNKRASHTRYYNAYPQSAKTESVVDETTLGFVFTNEIKQMMADDEGVDAETYTLNLGRGTHRPHLVRGHLHHYHTKEGLILKYVEPYFTGQNCDFISKTICK